MSEAIDFHFKFKPLAPGLKREELPQRMELDRWKGRRLAAFSSGMRQRVALALAFYTDSSLLVLDEPTVTLDQAGQQWFKSQLALHRNERLIVIASNVASDLEDCQHILTLGVKGLEILNLNDFDSHVICGQKYNYTATDFRW
ncbi:MAG: ATP-binding cassette domain-containing protein [Lewinella sp.]|nr:ATP-binding cassette domain-containing protein [Lewinella sp.]